MEGHQARSREKGELHLPEGLARSPEAQLVDGLSCQGKKVEVTACAKRRGHIEDLMRAMVATRGGGGLER